MNEQLSQLRPWTVGELIDRSATYWRRRLKPLFQLMLGFQLAQFAMGKAYVFMAQRYFPQIMSGRATMNAQAGLSPEVTRELLFFFATMSVFFFVSTFVYWCASVVLSRFIIDDTVGRGGDVKGAFARLRKRIGTMAGVFVLMHLWAFAVFALSFLPGTAIFAAGAFTGTTAGVIAGGVVGGLLLFFVPLGATLWYFLRVMLVPTVLAVEERGVLDTLKRSGALISGRIGVNFLDRVFVRATIVLTVVFAVVLIVIVVSSVPQGILQVVFGNILDPGNANPNAIPQALLIPAELIEAVAAALMTPLTTVLAAVFYLDMRMRREGLDLELKLNAAEAPR